MLVSVIIPTYQRANLLNRALTSVFSQSYQQIEVLVIDDGSTDDTSKVVKRFSERINYYYIPHSGVSRARNVGIKHAHGKWIAFLDSDDYWLPDKLRKQMHYLSCHPEYLICHCDEIWIKNGRRINQGKKHKKYPGWFFYPSLWLCLISPSSVVIHLSVLKEVGLFDESFDVVEDYELWLRITQRFPVGYLDEKLVVKTGGHSDQLSSTIDGIEGYRIKALEKLIRSNCLREHFLEQAIEAYRKKCNIYINGCLKRGRYDEAEKVKLNMKNLCSEIKGSEIKITV